jgi:hypothetical protein
MNIPGAIPKQIDSVAWQDYRATDKGMIIYYNTDPVSEVPIREVPEEYPSQVVPEPNYETGSYGFYGCERPKIRQTFARSKVRFLFFMTKYAGTNTQMLDLLMVTGYYRINKTADVQKFHMRYLQDYACMTEETCVALKADEMRFVSVKDAFILTPEVLQQWNCNARVTRQTRILLDEQATSNLLEYLRSKPDMTADYVRETKRLLPDTGEEEQDVEPEETGEGIAAEKSTAETTPQEEPGQAIDEAPATSIGSPASQKSSQGAV